MAVTTVTLETQHVPGNQRETITEVTFPESSTEGGEALTIKTLGLSKIAYPPQVWITNGSETEEYVGFVTYSRSEEKIKPWSVKTGKLVVKEKNLSKLKCIVKAVGY
jgi:hypothetical protein